MPIFGAPHPKKVPASAPIMPLLVRNQRDIILALPHNAVMLRPRGLPPLRTVVPFPVALAVRLCSDEPIRLPKFDQSVVLLVAVDARDAQTLGITIFHGVGVVALLGIQLETPAAHSSPAIRALACHRGWSVSVGEETLPRNFSHHHDTANTVGVSECLITLQY